MTHQEARRKVERGMACGRYPSVQARRLQAEISLLERNNLPLSDWGQLEALGRTSDWADSFASWVRRRSRARALGRRRRMVVLPQPHAETHWITAAPATVGSGQLGGFGTTWQRVSVAIPSDMARKADRSGSRELERNRQAAEDALQQLDWAIGYLTGAGKGEVAKTLASNRSHIRK
jgi:hypothetical protein